MTDVKKCPYCGEDIKLEAKKCKHCKTFLSEEDNALTGVVAPVRPQEEKPTERNSDSYFTGNSLKSWIIPVIAAIVILYFFSGIFNGNSEDVAGEPEEAVEEPTETTPTSFVAGVVGDETNHSEEEFENPIIEVGIDGEEFNIILIGNDNLSTDYIMRKMLIDSCELFENAFAEFPEINSTYIDWHFPLVDAYGNVELNSVMTIKLTRETEDKINWENFMTDNLPDVADFYWQHVAMN